MTGKLRVLVADDELVARKRLARLLAGIAFVERVGECAGAAEVFEAIDARDVDVVLLDIHMPGPSGLEIARRIEAGGPRVIFCTAHVDHALEAFEIGAVDYLMKPIDAARLTTALERARTRVARLADPPTLEAREAAPARLAIPTRSGVVLLDPSQVSHAAIEGELVTIFSAQGDHLTDYTLNELEQRLPPGRFTRVHRRALLSLEHVVRLEPAATGGFVARTSRGHAVEVSRQAARELRRKLGLRRGPDEKDGG